MILGAKSYSRAPSTTTLSASAATPVLRRLLDHEAAIEPSTCAQQQESAC
jgi:hypothetical protein